MSYRPLNHRTRKADSFNGTMIYLKDKQFKDDYPASISVAEVNGKRVLTLLVTDLTYHQIEVVVQLDGPSSAVSKTIKVGDQGRE